jgi:acylphosphatase
MPPQLPGASMAAGKGAAHDRPDERREVHYAGHVQGVGFRYSVQHLAGGFSVAGFVRNLADGRVQLVAEGAPPELDRFLAAVDQRMAGHIRDQQVDVRPATGEFSGFDVRY